MASTKEPSREAQSLLRLLRDHRNVLISGPVGTGKSRLLAEVTGLFTQKGGGPGYIPESPIAIPAAANVNDLPFMPSPERTNRRAFQTAFHAGSKSRDFLRGIVPVVGRSGSLEFQVTNGTLYSASEHGRLPDGAALLVIDELNRGPAVTVFGPAIVALDPDKRLGTDGLPTPTTQDFLVLDDAGRERAYQLPSHLYILAAMNQADTSVAGLDVAFLRRFAPFHLVPSESVAKRHFGLDQTELVLPVAVNSANDVWALLIAAWREVNSKLSLARSPDYQIGHAVLMFGHPPTELPEAKEYAGRAWSAIRQHIDEVFFGDTRALGEVLAAGKPGSPYKISDEIFAGQPKIQLVGPDHLLGNELTEALKAIAG